jgi:hypothetical protein
MAEVSAAAIAGSRRVPDRAAPASTGSLRRRGAWLAVAKQFVADSPLEGDGFEPLVPQGRRDCPFRDHLDWPTAPSLPRETTYLARETWSSSPVCSCGESGELPIVAECIYFVVGDLVLYGPRGNSFNWPGRRRDLWFESISLQR